MSSLSRSQINNCLFCVIESLSICVTIFNSMSSAQKQRHHTEIFSNPVLAKDASHISRVAISGASIKWIKRRLVLMTLFCNLNREVLKSSNWNRCRVFQNVFVFLKGAFDERQTFTTGSSDVAFGIRWFPGGSS